MRDRVRAGELTERSLARLTGISQPHLHNVLKGARSLSWDSADQILEHLNLSLSDLLSGSEPGTGSASGATDLVPRLSGIAGPSFLLGAQLASTPPNPLPRTMTASLVDPVTVELAHDPGIFPYFRAGDVVLVDRLPLSREDLRTGGVYLVETDGGTLVRSVRVGGSRLYLLTPGMITEPRNWHQVPLSGGDVCDLIKGRIVWVARHLTDDPFGPATDPVRSSR